MEAGAGQRAPRARARGFGGQGVNVGSPRSPQGCGDGCCFHGVGGGRRWRRRRLGHAHEQARDVGGRHRLGQRGQRRQRGGATIGADEGTRVQGQQRVQPRDSARGRQGGRDGGQRRVAQRAERSGRTRTVSACQTGRGGDPLRVPQRNAACSGPPQSRGQAGGGPGGGGGGRGCVVIVVAVVAARPMEGRFLQRPGNQVASIRQALRLCLQHRHHRRPAVGQQAQALVCTHARRGARTPAGEVDAVRVQSVGGGDGGRGGPVTRRGGGRHGGGGGQGFHGDSGPAECAGDNGREAWAAVLAGGGGRQPGKRGTQRQLGWRQAVDRAGRAQRGQDAGGGGGRDDGVPPKRGGRRCGDGRRRRRPRQSQGRQTCLRQHVQRQRVLSRGRHGGQAASRGHGRAPAGRRGAGPRQPAARRRPAARGHQGRRQVSTQPPNGRAHTA